MATRNPSKGGIMLTHEEALQTILEHALPLPQRRLRMEALLGHVLAQPVIAKFELPRFDNSAVDGFGVLLSDVDSADLKPSSLKLIGTLEAGSSEHLELSRGTTIKILTGAPVPPGTEAVVMREFCEESNGHVTIRRRPRLGENIRRRGEEIAPGQLVIPAGVRVTPPVIGMLATLGYPSFIIHDKPRVSLVITGDELIRPGLPLGPGQIYNSNSYALQAAIQALGIDEWSCHHAHDTKKSTRQNFQIAIEQADIIISSGGVSVGDKDYVKEVLAELGVKPIFWGIAVKPGKPVFFGIIDLPKKKGRKLIFGLPGNPVSALVTFHQFVKPAIFKCMGKSRHAPEHLYAKLKSPLRKVPGRLDFVRATLEPEPTGEVYAQPTVGQDSHMLSGLALAKALVYFGAELSELSAGSIVRVDEIDWWE